MNQAHHSGGAARDKRRILQDKIVQAEEHLFSLRAEFQALEENENPETKEMSFEEAAKHVRQDYNRLLQRLSQ